MASYTTTRPISMAVPTPPGPHFAAVIYELYGEWRRRWRQVARRRRGGGGGRERKRGGARIVAVELGGRRGRSDWRRACRVPCLLWGRAR